MAQVKIEVLVTKEDAVRAGYTEYGKVTVTPTDADVRALLPLEKEMLLNLLQDVGVLRLPSASWTAIVERIRERVEVEREATKRQAEYVLALTAEQYVSHEDGQTWLQVRTTDKISPMIRRAHLSEETNARLSSRLAFLEEEAKELQRKRQEEADAKIREIISQPVEDHEAIPAPWATLSEGTKGASPEMETKLFEHWSKVRLAREQRKRKEQEEAEAARALQVEGVRAWVAKHVPDLTRAVEEGYKLGNAPAKHMAMQFLSDFLKEDPRDLPPIIQEDSNAWKLGEWEDRIAPTLFAFQTRDWVVEAVDKFRPTLPDGCKVEVLPVQRWRDSPGASSSTMIIVFLDVPSCKTHMMLIRAEPE